MNLGSPVPPKDQKERENLVIEVVNAERQLWVNIHSKGLLDTEVQDLYRKVRSCYEKIILNNHEVVKLQDVEFSLWKLHYKHIDEFRKRIQQSSASTDSIKSATPQNVASVQNGFDSHIEGFKSFLSEAAEFYQNLIAKLRRCCGLPEEPLFYEKGGLSSSVELKTLHKCQYSCHRFLVCLGDLARYRELCKKSDFQNHKWSVAATYYFEATMIWPDSGNPQNQLALLATYVGDDFIALYHCVRSLAVKEPFPDAWDNLILLFEKNMSHWQSPSGEVHFNFSKPAERIILETKSQSSRGSSNNSVLEATEDVSSVKKDLWPLFVRMISFFFIESSLKDFPCAFALTVRELEALVALDDTELKAGLESYQHMDSARKGPYRALQVVSILIFIIYRLTKSPELKELGEKNDMQQPMLTQLALTATFICMGRLLERCKKGNSLDFCPILPAVLVFSEWLVCMLDNAETYCTDEKVGSAMSYFFGAFVDLLNRLDNSEGEVKNPDHTAVWEDYELRGFAPIAHAHASLDFISHWEHMGNFSSGNVSRAQRIFCAGMKIAERSNDSRNWVCFDKLGRKFYTPESIKILDRREAEVAESSSDLEVEEPHRHESGATKEYEEDAPLENQSLLSGNGKSVAMEEEEVILFKPITRYNSAPICSSITTNDQISIECMMDKTATSDECLRRATSLYVAQSQSQQADPLNIHNFRFSRPSKQQEPLSKDSATYPAGPPSLSAWVFNRESLNIEREKGPRDFSKHVLDPIEEIASASLSGLSVCGTEDSPFGAEHVSATAQLSPLPPPYSLPVPSAPLLPDDATWFSGNTSSFSDCKSSVGIKETDGILGASPSCYTNWSATHGPLNFAPLVPAGLDYRYPLPGLSSSDWLRQYTNNQIIERANNHTLPDRFCAPGNVGNFHGQHASGLDLFNQWGTPLASSQMVFLENPQLYPSSPLIHGADQQNGENLFLGYQRPSPYGNGGGMDLRVEQPQLLHYLKDREWQLQQQSRGPTFMWN
ncbi:nonsense-mediated mRNA decay factor SMG7-like [Cornus florida]|uniref:nonsense-mediated mRNA decay factor SMG7-like n=1 Tax=Cornus florida TaxID=4283 RepID=UPI002898423E|nr:nonsense-mediated mRNA decay factor SMG7-like [Cornus florida]XP_059670806.1 nonsense-mediated mRNA decay factor SMG7-like [Cornus florida]